MSPSLIVGILSALITLVTPLLGHKDVTAEDCGKATAMLAAGAGGLAYHRRTFRKKTPEERAKSIDA